MIADFSRLPTPAAVTVFGSAILERDRQTYGQHDEVEQHLVS